jgi:hypothetical protein
MRVLSTRCRLIFDYKSLDSVAEKLSSLNTMIVCLHTRQ